MARKVTKTIRPHASRLTQRTRRRVIVLGGAVMAALLLASAFVIVPGSMASSVLKLVIALLTIAGFALVMTRSIYWYVGNAPDGDLDERELALRNRSYFKAYALFAGLSVLSAFYLLDLAPDLGLWMPTHYDQWWSLAWALLILALAAPAAFVAWDEPDPELDV